MELFFFGAIVGSFLNVLIDRLPKDLSIVYPPSHCDYCKKALAWYDLIPVLSFILLRGRCRYCKKQINLQYPVVELLTGALFMLVAFSSTSPLGNHWVIRQLAEPDGLPWGGSWELLFTLYITSSLIVIFFTDLKYGIIPDKIVFPAIAISFVFLVSQYPNILISHFLSALGAFLFFLAIFLATRGRGMGFGDVKLAFLLGLLFGFPNIAYVLYTAFLTGAIFSIILIILRRKKLKEEIVFGPFLVGASLFGLFFGDKIETLWSLPVVLH